MKRLLYAYAKLLADHPFKTQIVSCGFLTGAGDAICQTLIEERKPCKWNYDYWRTLRFILVGGGLLAPFEVFWYRFVSNRTTGSRHVKSLKMLVFDQIFMAPVFIASYLSILKATEGKSIEEIKEYLRSDYLTVVIVNAQTWIPVQTVNFFVVPLQYRVLMSQSVSVLWNTYISFKTNRLMPNDSKDLCAESQKS